MEANQSSLLWDFWWLRCVNHDEFIKEFVVCAEKHVFVQKCLQMDSTWVCHCKAESKR